MSFRPNIAIDGPAGAGKSTVARLVAEELGYTYVDTGAMYRALALLALRCGVDAQDEEKLARLAESARLELMPGENGALKIFLNGEDVSREIRDPSVSQVVSHVARVPAVRRRLAELQRALARGGGVVMEGRDIGTAVLPGAEVKVFLTASVAERARRRREELAARGYKVNQRQVEEEIIQRDALDSSREVDPLMPAPDAFVIDCSSLTVEQVVRAIISRVKKQER